MLFYFFISFSVRCAFLSLIFYQSGVHFLFCYLFTSLLVRCAFYLLFLKFLFLSDVPFLSLNLNFL